MHADGTRQNIPPNDFNAYIFEITWDKNVIQIALYSSSRILKQSFNPILPTRLQVFLNIFLKSWCMRADGTPQNVFSSIITLISS